MSTRRTWTPAERATDKLDTARRVEQRIAKQRDKLKAALAEVEREHATAVRRVEYLATDPDLPANQPTEAPNDADTEETTQ